ncbi:MAG: hypothetical protein EOS07_34765 [Mesorhizobium sp.]|nr:MAG: hypothetical protein EOS07_34765 [Mesorhizobium sp.]
MNTAEITIPLGKLVPSKANVRRVNSEAGKAELAASIEAHGLIHNLVARKAAKGRKLEVVAGGRRLGALRLLLDAGQQLIHLNVIDVPQVRPPIFQFTG